MTQEAELIVSVCSRKWPRCRGWRPRLVRARAVARAARRSRAVLAVGGLQPSLPGASWNSRSRIVWAIDLPHCGHCDHVTTALDWEWPDPRLTASRTVGVFQAEQF